MYEILDKVEDRGRMEGTELANIEAIKKMMSKLKMSAEQAMETLDIPQSDRPKYADRIPQSPYLTTILKQQTLQ
ncbi:MAG: hypothetical protein IK093_16455 [Ruminiclostridium sp.]|nr:hypothetical protein [Ruminiclostridium sp.]